MNLWNTAIVLAVGAILACRFATLDRDGWPSLDHCVGMWMYAGGMCIVVDHVQDWGL